MTTTREAALEQALKAMLQSVCGPTGFAEAVRHNSGHAYPWHSLDAAEAQARAAISTPATEPQGYVEAAEWMRSEARTYPVGHESKERCQSTYNWMWWCAKRLDEAARPAPQPAADTRLVTVEQLQTWMGYTGEHGGAAKFVKEIRAIIGNATAAKP